MPSLRTTLAQAALVAVLTFTLYSIGLAVSPPHLTHDEIKFALQAKSVADTGRDINGRRFPLYFIEPGFAVGRDPICIYVTAAFLTVLPLSEQSIRLATVFIGACGAGLMFLLARLMFARRSVAWIVALILALSPTYYIHSRLALSVLYPVPFTVLWLLVLQIYLRGRRPRQAFIVGGVLGLGVYTYLAAAMMMPLYLAATTTMLALQRDWRGIRIILVGFAVLMLPLLVWQVIEPDRYANILSAYRLYESEPSGSGGGLLQHLASASGLASRIHIFWDAFNPGRWFFTGESSLQISTRQIGSFLTPVAVFLAVGLVTLARNRAAIDRHLGLLVAFGLLTAPLPGVIMADTEIRRWLVVVPFIALVAGVGVERLLTSGARARAIAVLFLVLIPVQFVAFTRDYFGPYRERSSGWFGGNIRAAMQTVLDQAQANQPSAVYIATEIPWVEAYWRFYSAARNVDLLDRTRYVQLRAGEMPRAHPGAVFVTPTADASLASQLTAAGWTAQHTIPDLDGRPSLMVSTVSAP